MTEVLTLYNGALIEMTIFFVRSLAISVICRCTIVWVYKQCDIANDDKALFFDQLSITC